MMAPAMHADALSPYGARPWVDGVLNTDESNFEVALVINDVADTFSIQAAFYKKKKKKWR